MKINFIRWWCPLSLIASLLADDSTIAPYKWQLLSDVKSPGNKAPYNLCTNQRMGQLYDVDLQSDLVYDVDRPCTNDGKHTETCANAGCLWWDCHYQFAYNQVKKPLNILKKLSYCDCCVLTVDQVNQVRSVPAAYSSPQILSLQLQIDQFQHWKRLEEKSADEKSEIEATQKSEIDEKASQKLANSQATDARQVTGAENKTLSAQTMEINSLIRKFYDLLVNNAHVTNATAMYSAELLRMEKKLTQQDEELTIDEQELQHENVTRPASHSACTQVLAPEIQRLQRHIEILQEENKSMSAKGALRHKMLVLAWIIIICMLPIGSVVLIALRRPRTSVAWSEGLQEPLLPQAASEVAPNIEKKDKECRDAIVAVEHAPAMKSTTSTGLKNADAMKTAEAIKNGDAAEAMKTAEIAIAQEGAFGNVDFSSINDDPSDQDLRQELDNFVTPRGSRDEKSFFRIIKVQCSGVSHKAVSCEIIFNGCIVTIQKEASLGVAGVPWKKKFQFSPSDGLFEFQDDQMKLEDGYLTIVFRAFINRIVRFQQHTPDAWSSSEDGIDPEVVPGRSYNELMRNSPQSAEVPPLDLSLSPTIENLVWGPVDA